MLVEMILRRGLLGLGLVFIGGGGTQAQRLPGGLRPEHYSITITPDLKAAKFAGSETIEVVLDRPVSAITLNAAEIDCGVAKALWWPAAVVEGKKMQVPFGTKQSETGMVTLEEKNERRRR